MLELIIIQAKISAEAKYIKKVNSEIMNFISKIIKYISIAIVRNWCVIIFGTNGFGNI